MQSDGGQEEAERIADSRGQEEAERICRSRGPVGGRGKAELWGQEVLQAFELSGFS